MLLLNWLHPLHGPRRLDHLDITCVLLWTLNLAAGDRLPRDTAGGKNTFSVATVDDGAVAVKAVASLLHFNPKIVATLIERGAFIDVRADDGNTEAMLAAYSLDVDILCQMKDLKEK